LAGRFDDSLDLDNVADEAITRFLVACIEGRVDEARNPDAYLLRIARNAAVDLLRVQREDPGEVPDFDDPRPFDAFATVVSSDLVEWLFCRLRSARDVEARRVLAAARDLAYAGDQPTIRSVAERSEITPSSTYRAVLRIRAVLETVNVERDPPSRRSTE
jgi:hypothetical protein